MRKLMLAVLGATLTLAAGAPALAQDWRVGGYPGWSPAWGHGPALPPDRGQPQPYEGGSPFHRDDHGLRERVDRMGAWVGSGQSQGWLSPWEVRRAFGELHAVSDQARQMEWREGDLGLGQSYALNARLDGLADRLQHAKHEGW